MIFVLGIIAITALNFGLGYRWSRLTENPWSSDSPFGHSSFRPLFARDLTVEEINSQGRTMMVMAPIGAAVMLFIFAMSGHS